MIEELTAFDHDEVGEFLERRERFLKKCRREIRRTAHHEAGHAVAHVVRCIPMDWVAIQPLPPEHDGLIEDQEDFGVFDMGVTQGSCGYSWSDLEHIWCDMLVMLYAGPVAEMRFIGSGRLMLMKGDRDQIRRCLAASKMDSPRMERDYRDLANLFVDRHWHQIEAVAAALVDRRYLDSREVRRIIKASA